MSEAAARHTPVMLERCLELLSPALTTPGAVLIDGTLGMGGHSEAILRALDGVTVIGIDRDEQAIALASERLEWAGERFRPYHGTYDDIEGALQASGCATAQGILLDLGVSSLHLDDADRGFSYANDAPLDMRMDRSEDTTAAALLATATEQEIARILFAYGEERFARRIARSIVARRSSDPVVRSSQLVDVVRASIPAAARATGGNPAKRTFQALRIAVNRELDILESAITAAIDALPVGGRLVVMSYQSLEDRIVKQAFVAGATSSAPAGLPVIPEQAKPYLNLLTKGAEKASEAEIARNSRSKPVRLRAVERIRATQGRAA